MRLVEHEQRRLVQKRATEGKPLRHAAGECCDALGARVPQAEALEEHADSLAPLRHAVEAAVEVEVLERRELAVEERLVTDVSDAPALQRHVDCAPRRGDEPHEEPQQRRLARPAGSRHDESALLTELERDIAEHAPSSVALLDCTDDGRLGHSGTSPSATVAGISGRCAAAATHDNHPQGHPRCPDVTLSPTMCRMGAVIVPEESRARRLRRISSARSRRRPTPIGPSQVARPPCRCAHGVGSTGRSPSDVPVTRRLQSSIRSERHSPPPSARSCVAWSAFVRVRSTCSRDTESERSTSSSRPPPRTRATSACVTPRKGGRCWPSHPICSSVAMSSAAAAVERRRQQQSRASAGEVVQLEAADAFPGEVLRALRRRRLPFRPDDVVLLLDLGTSTLKRDRVFEQSFETVSLAVSAATQSLRGPAGRAPLLGALDRLGLAIDGLELPPTSEAGELRRRIQALLAANVPGGMLDLSVLDARDAWAMEAEEVLRRHSGERWTAFSASSRCSPAPRGRRPTAAWRREATEAAEHCESFGALLQELLEPLLRIDLSTSGIPRPPGWLLAPGNEVIAKGAIWATAEIDEPWVVPLLGRLALRGAAPAPHAGVTRRLFRTRSPALRSRPSQRGDLEAATELRTLLAEIRRRDRSSGSRQSSARRRPRRATATSGSVARSDAPSSRRPLRTRLTASDWRRTMCVDLAPSLRVAGFADAAQEDVLARPRPGRDVALHGGCGGADARARNLVPIRPATDEGARAEWTAAPAGRPV